jgi:hypothetical protein
MKFLKASGIAILLSVSMSPVAFAETTIKVTLIGKAGTADVNAAMGMKADMSKAKMGINISPKKGTLARCVLM